MVINDTEDSVHEDNKSLVHELARRDGLLISPIDLSMDTVQHLSLPKLRWMNFDNPPTKMKISNTGETVIVSAKWGNQRPHLAGGPLDSNYVFSQIHFHWGSDEHEGSEHTIRGICYPMEMHVVFFKTRYLSLDSALKKEDGVIILVYLFKLQDQSISGLHWLASHMDRVVEPYSSTLLPLSPLSALMVPFTRDYLLYWGALATQRCSHTMLWFVSRAAMAISVEDLNLFRRLMNSRKEFMNKNFRETKPALGRTVFHVNPSGETKHLLLPSTIEPPSKVMVVNYNQMPALNKEQAWKIFSQGDGSGEESDKKSLATVHNETPVDCSLNTYIFCEGSVRSESKKSVLKLPNNLVSESNSVFDQNEGSSTSRSDSIKRKQALSRKLLENERKTELKSNKTQQIQKINDSSVPNLGEAKLRKANKTTDKKNFTSKKLQTNVKYMPVEELRKKLNQSQIEPNKWVHLTSPVAAISQHPQTTQTVEDSSIAEENLKSPKKIVNNEMTTNIPFNTVETPKEIRSKLPVMVKNKELKSSLARYFTRPESAPSPQHNARKPPAPRKTSTPLERASKIKSPIKVIVPKPKSAIPKPTIAAKRIECHDLSSKSPTSPSPVSGRI